MEDMEGVRSIYNWEVLHDAGLLFIVVIGGPYQYQARGKVYEATTDSVRKRLTVRNSTVFGIRPCLWISCYPLAWSDWIFRRNQMHVRKGPSSSTLATADRSSDVCFDNLLSSQPSHQRTTTVRDLGLPSIDLGLNGADKIRIHILRVRLSSSCAALSLYTARKISSGKTIDIVEQDSGISFEQDVLPVWACHHGGKDLPAGLLDLVCTCTRHGASGAWGKTGTEALMAVGALRGEQHTFMHDLESFFRVLFWVSCVDAILSVTPIIRSILATCVTIVTCFVPHHLQQRTQPAYKPDICTPSMVLAVIDTLIIIRL
ncbi:hypothetical protein CONLIGDRAFT_687886 [Coniochaeta ligniaria NRRL 30616]|uniref:Fungal-type protein kinase domain-containing protein n=1 Tax=Coniochaeta ligniaria NRRL 30616 TaxID=1408157 RepID=A0A1J7IWY0_9PEZI|nr:hypothetical protein CONLIGDRAFT_687886 [Coniochaeta ligniaria NRRL 30616]